MSIEKNWHIKCTKCKKTLLLSAYARDTEKNAWSEAYDRGWRQVVFFNNRDAEWLLDICVDCVRQYYNSPDALDMYGAKVRRIITKHHRVEL